MCLENLLEISTQCIQMVCIESPRGLRRVSSTSLQCIQMAYIESLGLYRVSSSKNNDRGQPNQSQRTIVMSY